MPQIFKDLVPNEADGKLRLQFKNRAGMAVLQDVCAEIASPLVQDGTRWTAACANRLLLLDDAAVPQLNLDGGTY
ncbi:MAG: hypothetical protein RSC73_02635 [Ruthenibacterium sp.]